MQDCRRNRCTAVRDCCCKSCVGNLHDSFVGTLPCRRIDKGCRKDVYPVLVGCTDLEGDGAGGDCRCNDFLYRINGCIYDFDIALCDKLLRNTVFFGCRILHRCSDIARTYSLLVDADGRIAEAFD